MTGKHGIKIGKRGKMIVDSWQMIDDRKNVLIRWSLAVGSWREERSKYDSVSSYGAYVLLTLYFVVQMIVGR